MSAERTIATTDLLARQEGAFERCTIRGITPVSEVITSGGSPTTDELTIPTSCFNARHILVRLETVDGVTHTLALSPDFTAYDNRLDTLHEMRVEGTVWYAHRDDLTDGVRDWNAVLTQTPERAKQVTDNGAPFGGLTLTDLVRHAGRMITTLGGVRGNLHTRQRPDDVLTAYDRQHYTDDLPSGQADLSLFLDVAPTGAESAEILDVPSHNTLIMLKDGQTFPLHFDGRATNDDHTPTQLAEALGVKTVENLANERVQIAPNVHSNLLSFTPVGSNTSETFALGPL